MTALGKILNSSEDTSLNKLIEIIIKELQLSHLKSKNKSTPLSLEKSTATEVTQLIEYCNLAVGCKKPEWQILAERHGWTPPK
jgi:hypothetical protein